MIIFFSWIDLVLATCSRRQCLLPYKYKFRSGNADYSIKLTSLQKKRLVFSFDNYDFAGIDLVPRIVDDSVDYHENICFLLIALIA